MAKIVLTIEDVTSEEGIPGVESKWDNDTVVEDVKDATMAHNIANMLNAYLTEIYNTIEKMNATDALAEQELAKEVAEDAMAEQEISEELAEENPEAKAANG